MVRDKINKQNNYNNVPVHYCGICISLKVLVLSEAKDNKEEICYCGECGNSEIKKGHIRTFERLYHAKHKHHHIDS